MIYIYSSQSESLPALVKINAKRFIRAVAAKITELEETKLGKSNSQYPGLGIRQISVLYAMTKQFTDNQEGWVAFAKVSTDTGIPHSQVGPDVHHLAKKGFLAKKGPSIYKRLGNKFHAGLHGATATISGVIVLENGVDYELDEIFAQLDALPEEERAKPISERVEYIKRNGRKPQSKQLPRPVRPVSSQSTPTDEKQPVPIEAGLTKKIELLERLDAELGRRETTVQNYLEKLNACRDEVNAERATLESALQIVRKPIAVIPELEL